MRRSEAGASDQVPLPGEQQCQPKKPVMSTFLYKMFVRLTKVKRTTWLFLIGVVGVAHETLARDFDRPYLLALFAGALGLPLVVNVDKDIRESDKK